MATTVEIAVDSGDSRHAGGTLPNGLCWGGTRPRIALGVVASLGFVCALCAVCAGPLTEIYRTRRYLSQLDLEQLALAATDCVNPRVSPLRLGKPLDELDIVYDYDFARLHAVEQRLRKVNRRQALAEIFRRVTVDCQTDRARHEAITLFCDRVGFNNLIQPMWQDRLCVYDPLILLELGEQRCGQTARVAVDLFLAAGYRARLVQVSTHVTAEVYYDGDWHLLEVGLFGNGVVPRANDGSIPSVVELSDDPGLLDALPHGQEARFDNQPLLGSIEYPSMFFFNRSYYRTVEPAYCEKMASKSELRDRHYGWLHCTLEPGDWQLSDLPQRYLPGAPHSLVRQGSRLTWTPSDDADGDLLGYRVYVGSRPRGWCYGPGWRPEMYAARFQEPPCDVAFLETSAPSVELPTINDRPLYVTVLPYDRHGESVGRRIYPASEELVLSGD